MAKNIKVIKSDDKNRNCRSCQNSILGCEILRNTEEYTKLPENKFEDIFENIDRCRYEEKHICKSYENIYSEYPLEVSKIDIDLETYCIDKRSIGKFVAIRPCAEEYKNKTYLGLFLGDIPVGIDVRYRNKSKVLKTSFDTFPAIFVFDLNKIVFGYESWWGVIKSEKQLKSITDYDIENIWYVKALKQLSN